MTASTKWKVGTAVILAIVCGIVVANKSRPSPPPSTFSVTDVPRMAYRGELAGRRIRIVLRFPLAFAADRRTAIYSPSPGGEAAKTCEFHFREPINYSPDIVEGTVVDFKLDAMERLNRLPGFVVMDDCVPD